MSDLIVEDQHDQLNEMLKTVLSNPAIPVTREFRGRHAHDDMVQVEITGTNQLDDPEVASIVFTARDVTARHQALDLQESQTKVFELIATGGPLDHTLESLVGMVEHHLRDVVATILVVENDLVRIGGGRGLPEEVRSAIEGTGPTQWFGCWRGALLGAGSVSVPDIATSELYATYAKHFLDAGLHGCMSLPIEDPEARKPIAALVLYFRESHNIDEHELNVASNATRLAAIALQRHNTELRLSHLAHHDKLTGLPNRALLQSRMENAVRHAQRHDSAVAIMFVDLDDFKSVNDELGHDAGDHTLRNTASSMRSALRDNDLLARLGGDEFIAVLPGLTDSPRVGEIAARAVCLARDLVNEGPSRLTPKAMANQARRLARSSGLRCTVLGRPELETLGMKALLAVSRGSAEPPRAVRAGGPSRRGGDRRETYSPPVTDSTAALPKIAWTVAVKWRLSQ